MKYLILVKHSLPEIVEDLPSREWLLSEEGRRRAQILSCKLHYYLPEVVISSEELKAIQTAEIVANELRLPMKIFENLHEHDRSKAAFLSEEGFESKVQEFFNNPDELVFGSETANQSHDRFSSAVYPVLNKYKSQNIVIVAHGTVISLFVSRLNHLPEFSLWEGLGLPSFVVLDRQSHTLIAKENIA